MELDKLKNKLIILRIVHYVSIFIFTLCLLNIMKYGNNAPLKELSQIGMCITLIDLIIMPIFIKKIKTKIENIENIEIALRDTKKDS